MSYLSLPEAAEYLQHRTGVEINDASVLRMGTMGHLLIVAYFDGFMQNLTTRNNEEVVGHLVIPPRHLAAIENDGEAIIIGASSLDGRAFYSPQAQRTRAQLRVLTSELDRIAPFLFATPAAAHPREAGTPPSDEKTKAQKRSLLAKEKRAKIDFSTLRGARRRILEGWDAIEAEYGPDADAHEVLRVLSRDGDEKKPEKKTVQNILGDLRKEGTIPGNIPGKFPGVS
jgi:hypothetical protein